MFKRLLCAVVITLSFVGATDAQSAYKTTAMTGAEIAKLCANEKGQCFQFVFGYLTALEPIYAHCLKPPTNKLQASAAIIKYIEINPQRHHYRFVQLADRAIETYFKCGYRPYFEMLKSIQRDPLNPFRHNIRPAPK